ncbi:MAG: cytochrome c3 family protein [bacterium]
MTKKGFMLFAAAFAVFAIVVGHAAALADCVVDPRLDFIVINYTEEHGTDKFAPVPFTHKRHYVDYEVPCRACHHAWKVDIRDNPLKCKECHKGKEVSGVIFLRNAFHRSCLVCHREVRNRNKPTGPIGCKDCHVVPDRNSRRSP